MRISDWSSDVCSSDLLSAAQAAAVAASDATVDELLAADKVVIATGLINFGIASTLKTWIDHVARAGRTFRYGADGPQGLATGKQAYVVLAAGGVCSAGPAAAFATPGPFLNATPGFLGTPGELGRAAVREN